MPLTQAQIDAMKVTNEQMTAEINALVADGPGPSPVLDSITLYDGAFFGTKAFKVVGVSQNGNAYPPPRPAWGQNPTYTCKPGSSPMAKPGDVTGTATWSASSMEYHRVPAVPLVGQQWLWIDGYGTADGSAFYPVETTRADWVNLATGVVTDVTPPGPAPQGQPYMPALVMASGHFRIRIWGWIWNSMTAGRSGLFYWEGDFTYGTTMQNVAWKGDAQTTKPVIKISEGWWNGGHTGAWIDWSSGTSPYDASDNPIVPVVTYNGFNTNARGAGTMWVFSYAPNVAGIESIS
jgi:hypothetical protein